MFFPVFGGFDPFASSHLAGARLRPIQPKARLAQLTYYVWSERLIGSIEGRSFSIASVESGGGRGATKGVSANGGWSPYTRKEGTRRGGPLPPGLWLIEKPSVYRRTHPKSKYAPPVSRLVPIDVVDALQTSTGTTTPFGRDYTDAPFLIHGAGPLGSDGCLVIDKTHREALLNVIEKTKSDIYLRVSMEQMGDPVPSSMVGAMQRA